MVKKFHPNNSVIFWSVKTPICTVHLRKNHGIYLLGFSGKEGNPLKGEKPEEPKEEKPPKVEKPE